MRKITFYCDRCGKLIPDKSIMHQLMTKLIDVLDVCTSGFAEEEEEEGAELCADCYREIDDMVAFMVKNPKLTLMEPKAEAPVRKINHPHAKPLDMGKVFALRKAGWSLKKIADEFGVSGQTVSNQIKKYEEKNHNQEDRNND